MHKKNFLIAKSVIYAICVMLIFFSNRCAFGDSEECEDCTIKIIDGDSLEIGNKRIRLQGIDAPEYTQYCFDAKKEKYSCGIKSKEFLANMVAGHKLHCKKQAIDRYSREISVCYADDMNVNKAMVEAGWAIAYRTSDQDLLTAQQAAKRQQSGIYQGKFIAPELYRRLNKRKKVQNN